MVIGKGFTGNSLAVTGQDIKALTPELANALRLVFEDQALIIALNTEGLVRRVNKELPEDLHISAATLKRFVKDSTTLDVKMHPLYKEVSSIIADAIDTTKIDLCKLYASSGKFAELRKFEFIMLNKFKDWADSSSEADSSVQVGNRLVINIQNNNTMPPIKSEDEMIKLNEGA